MIDKNMCYKHLCGSTVIVSYFNTNKDHLSFEDYFGFKVSQIPLPIILQEPLLNSIHQSYKIKSGGIIRLDPNRCYRWHQDAVRGGSVNMLLYHKESFVLFGNAVSDSDDQFEIMRMEYEPNQFYLFNNQAMHTVVNFDSPRYMFTIEFELDKTKLSYDELFNSL